jgi:hypothetical protein
MSELNVIPNDNLVSALTQPALHMLEGVVAKYDLEPTVYLFETIHGHCARITRKEGRFIPGSENHPMRLDAEDATFRSALMIRRAVCSSTLSSTFAIPQHFTLYLLSIQVGGQSLKPCHICHRWWKRSTRQLKRRVMLKSLIKP